MILLSCKRLHHHLVLWLASNILVSIMTYIMLNGGGTTILLWWTAMPGSCLCVGGGNYMWGMAALTLGAPSAFISLLSYLCHHIYHPLCTRITYNMSDSRSGILLAGPRAPLYLISYIFLNLLSLFCVSIIGFLRKCFFPSWRFSRPVSCYFLWVWSPTGFHKSGLYVSPSWWTTTNFSSFCFFLSSTVGWPRSFLLLFHLILAPFSLAPSKVEYIIFSKFALSLYLNAILTLINI